MKLLVLSDSHGRDQHLFSAVYDNLDADAILFLGDGERDLPVLDAIPNIWRKRVVEVCGNCDYASSLPITVYEDFGGYKFYITHGFQQKVKYGFDYIAADARKQGRQVVLFGHTHRQHLEEREGLFLFNPGSIGNGEYGIIIIEEKGIHFFHKTL